MRRPLEEHRSKPNSPFDRIISVLPRDQSVSAVANEVPWSAFDPAILAFVAEFSRSILFDSSFRAHPELTALAYWMRPSQIQALKDGYDTKSDCFRRGRGLAFHVAPANVDTIFLYSLFLSLLAGNTNIVRISSRRTAQVGLALEVLTNVVAKPAFAELRSRLLLVNYEHDEAITRALSELSDLRIVWGGDSTVSTIRSTPLRPDAKEVTFPNRWSLAVIDAESFLCLADSGELVRKFGNDAYWFGQMACSSPQMIVWRGAPQVARIARQNFWAQLERLQPKLIGWLQPRDYIDKLVLEDSAAIEYPDVRIRRGSSNLVNVIEIPHLNADFLKLDHCGGGIFFEGRVDAISELRAIADRRLQTIASFGVSRAEWTAFLGHFPGPGISRIVPIGEALLFAAVWDGMDLLREFSHEVTIGIS